jgi:hypothetical protein
MNLKTILLTILFSSFLFSYSGEFHNLANMSICKKVQTLKYKKSKIESQIKDAEKKQEEIIYRQQSIAKLVKGMRKLANIYFQSRKICDTQRAKNTLNGMSYYNIEKSFKKCKRETGKNSVFGNHTSFMADLSDTKKHIQGEIDEATTIITTTVAWKLQLEYIMTLLEVYEEEAKDAGC